MFVPLECLHSQGDSINYVVKRNGLGYLKQHVVVGRMNANEAIIEEGVEEGEQLYLSVPVGIEESPISYLEGYENNIAKTD